MSALLLAPTELGERTSPYRGLEPYTEADWPYFFGRERECDVIGANLAASRLTLLYGASGAGKTSVLRAGVAHRLAEQAHKNRHAYGAPEHAVVVFSTWKDDPVATLQAHVAAAVADALGQDVPDPPPPSNSLVEALTAWSARLGGDLLIILDQFEEYFLYHQHEQGPDTFDGEFPRAVNKRDLPVNFLIGIREDALARLDRFKGRVPDLFANYLRLEHLDREDARDAIVKPLDEFNRSHPGGDDMSIESTLTEAVLDDLLTADIAHAEVGRGQPDVPEENVRIDPSYLQVVMTRLWSEEERAASATLRFSTFEGLGTAHDILEAHLDTTMRGLSENQRITAADIFHYLVTPSGSKVAFSAADLASYTKIDLESVEDVLDHLSRRTRILRSLPPFGRLDEPRYEIYHDRLADAILSWCSRYLRERQLAAEQARNLAQLRAYQDEAERKVAAVEARVGEQSAIAATRARRRILLPVAWTAVYWSIFGAPAAIALAAILVQVSVGFPIQVGGDVLRAVPAALVSGIVIATLVRSRLPVFTIGRVVRLSLVWAIGGLVASALGLALGGGLFFAITTLGSFRHDESAAQLEAARGFASVVAVLVGGGAAIVSHGWYCGRRTFDAVESVGGFEQIAFAQQRKMYAGFWARAIAFLIDVWLAVVLGVIVRVAAGTGTGTLVATGAYLMYTAVMECSPKQATLGKMVMGLRVMSDRGRRIGIARTILRSLAKVIFTFTYGVTVILMAFTRRKQTLHDLIARTQVVTRLYAPEPEASR